MEGLRCFFANHDPEKLRDNAFLRRVLNMALEQPEAAYRTLLIRYQDAPIKDLDWLRHRPPRVQAGTSKRAQGDVSEAVKTLQRQVRELAEAVSGAHARSQNRPARLLSPAENEPVPLRVQPFFRASRPLSPLDTTSVRWTNPSVMDRARSPNYTSGRDQEMASRISPRRPTSPQTRFNLGSPTTLQRMAYGPTPPGLQDQYQSGEEDVLTLLRRLVQYQQKETVARNTREEYESEVLDGFLSDDRGKVQEAELLRAQLDTLKELLGVIKGRTSPQGVQSPHGHPGNDAVWLTP